MTKFISPQTGAPEVVLAKDQPQYQQLPVAIYVDSDNPDAQYYLARVTLSDEERALIWGGQDIFISQMVFKDRLFAPIGCYVGPQHFTVKKEGEA